jgi:hypothetical protein
VKRGGGEGEREGAKGMMGKGGGKGQEEIEGGKEEGVERLREGGN